MVPFMIDNLGQKMVTSVIYFMYTLGKKNNKPAQKLGRDVSNNFKKPNPEELANFDLLLMEIETGS